MTREWRGMATNAWLLCVVLMSWSTRTANWIQTDRTAPGGQP